MILISQKFFDFFGVQGMGLKGHSVISYKWNKYIQVYPSTLTFFSLLYNDHAEILTSGEILLG